MSHEVETMVYTGAVPWHGLGNTLLPGSSLEEWPTQAGLDWTVSKRPVLFAGQCTGSGAGTGLHTVKDKFALVRDTDERAFSIVSDRYHAVQPKQILEFFRDLISDYGMTLETAGSLRNGQRVWAMAKTGDAHKVMGIDEVKGYCMLATSYDLTFSTLAYFTSVRVVCNNTLRQSFGDMNGKVKIPHFREFDMDAVKEQMGIGRNQWHAFTGMMDTLAGINLSVSDASSVMHKVFEIDATKTDKDTLLNIQHTAKVIDLFDGKSIGFDLAGRTGWGLVNATTEYLQKYKRAQNQSNRLDSAWFGDSAEIAQRAVDETLLLAA